MPRILAIETSCDETAAAVVDDGARIRSNIVLSQIPVHRLYGGVVPELASREHLRGIVPVVRQALEQAQTTLPELDAIAVTHGPGLVGALLVGLTFAQGLAFASAKPLIAVNHLAGHLHAVLLEERSHSRPDPPFPAIALVVSGGHTQLYRIDRAGTQFAYRTLGQTRDDAAGEAFDKVAKLLGLGYPGGPLLDRLAKTGDPGAVPFSRIRLKGNPLDFSFSGLKTAVLRYVQTRGLQPSATPGQPALDLIASFQNAVVTDLADRALAAVEASFDADEPPAASLFLTGGVAANSALRQRLAAAAAARDLPFFTPSIPLCTDNAAMIAAAAFPLFQSRAFAAAPPRAFAQLPLD